MKVLVTGGTGFTGSALVLKLLELGHAVRALDYKKGIRDGMLRSAGAELIYGSITSPDVVREAVAGCDFVFHLAAAFREIGVANSFYDEVNVGGTRHVMMAAKAAGVRRVIYCSTQGVHGHISDPPGDETASIAPEDYYQYTKYEGEKVVQEHIRDGMDAAIVRPTAIYGPGDPERFFMIFQRVQKGWFPMFGTGMTLYHPVYIDNLVDAFILLMDLSKGSGETYIIADEEYVSIEELVRRVARAMDKAVKIVRLPLPPLLAVAYACEWVCKPFKIAPPIFPRRADWYRQVRAFRIDKARRELGYEPRVGLDEGLRRTSAWYQTEGYLKNDGMHAKPLAPSI